MFAGIVLQVQLAQLEAEYAIREEKHFEAICETLDPADAAAARAERNARKEKARVEAATERRHRELCESIRKAGRSASFWPS